MAQWRYPVFRTDSLSEFDLKLGRFGAPIFLRAQLFAGRDRAGGDSGYSILNSSTRIGDDPLDPRQRNTAPRDWR